MNDEPRPTSLVGYPRHEERRATICQDEWRAWHHRGLVVWDARMLAWASARSEVLFDFIDEWLCLMCPNEPRSTGFVGYPRHEERRATIYQDEWRAWRHRGLVVWDLGMLVGVGY